MARPSSASVPSMDANGNPVIFQKVEMNPNQQWMPIGTSLSNIKTMLAFLEESPDHCPVAKGLDTSENTRKRFQKAILIETPNMMESTGKQGTLYIAQQLPSEANGTVRYYLPTTTKSDVKASGDPLPQCTEKNVEKVNVSEMNNFDERPIFHLNFHDNKMTQLPMVRPTNCEPAASISIYDTTMPLSNAAHDSSVVDDITKFTSHLTTSCRSAIQAIDPVVVYEMAYGEPSSYSYVASDLSSHRPSSHRALRRADLFMRYQREAASNNFVTSNVSTHRSTTGAVHEINPVIVCESESAQPASCDSVTTTCNVGSSVKSQVGRSDSDIYPVTDDNYKWWVKTWLKQIQISTCAESSENSNIDTNLMEVTKQDGDVPNVQVVEGHLVNIKVKKQDIILKNELHSTATKVANDAKPGCNYDHLKTSLDRLDYKTFRDQMSRKLQQDHEDMRSLDGSGLLSNNKTPEINTYIPKNQDNLGLCDFHRSELSQFTAKLARSSRKRMIDEVFVMDDTSPSKVVKYHI